RFWSSWRDNAIAATTWSTIAQHRKVRPVVVWRGETVTGRHSVLGSTPGRTSAPERASAAAGGKGIVWITTHTANNTPGSRSGGRGTSGRSRSKDQVRIP